MQYFGDVPLRKLKKFPHLSAPVDCTEQKESVFVDRWTTIGNLDFDSFKN